MSHWNESATLAFLFNLAIKGTVLFLIAFAGAFCLRRRSAAVRHLVWMGAFVAGLALPPLSLSVPALHVPRALWLPDPTSFVTSTRASASEQSVSSPAQQVNSPAMPARAGVKSTAWGEWPLYITLLWVLGATILLAQLAFAYGRLAWARRRAPAFDAPVNPPSIPLLQTPDGSMPMTFGVLRPVVFLPADAASWHPERRAIVLRHEMAHIQRGDVLTHLVARASLSLYWWNPLAWRAWREFLKDGEKAADDLVLETGVRASDYAGHLLEIARSMRAEPATAWAAVAMARRSQLEGRLLSILDSEVSRKSARRFSLLAVMAGAILFCVPFAAVRAQSQDPAIAADVDATIRAAAAQKNHEILDNAAAAFEKAQKYDTAQTLLTNGLKIRGDVSGEQSAEYAAGLVKLGDLETKRNRNDEAAAFYTKAVSLGDRAEVAPALVDLGTNSIGHKDLAAAASFLQRAIAVSNSPNTTGLAYMWLAMIEQNNPEHAAEAEEDFRKSIAALDPKSSEMATTLNLFSVFLSKQGRAAEAEPLRTQASSLQQTLVRTGISETDVMSKFVLHAGGDVTRPELLRKMEPEYSEAARSAKLEGTVVLYVTVQPDGSATPIRVLKSLGMGLDEKAIEAVQQWQFKPATKNGEPVAVVATIEVNFRLL
ncbi:MAG TPA: TonB family protein [Bryobacteraceae bacterium]|nr:TonB family protein [Bryobacteraceae bacterium]